MSLLRLNRHPAPRQLLVFALAWLGFVGGLGLMQWFKSRPNVALVCWDLAVAVPVIGWLWREGLRLLYVGLSLATYPIGYVVSSVVLALIYYAVLTPLGLVLRLGGHDALGRRFDPATSTYWRKRPAPRPAASYFRQH